MDTCKNCARFRIDSFCRTVDGDNKIEGCVGYICINDTKEIIEKMGVYGYEEVRKLHPLYGMPL